MTKTPLTKEEVEQYMNTEYSFPFTHNHKDLTGLKFGNLTVIKRIDNKVCGKKTAANYLCLCECGNYTSLISAVLRSEKTKSCGCLWVKTLTTHNMSNTKEFRTWSHILNRCHNPNDKRYKHYGGRGIFVSDDWRISFENFYRDMGNVPTPKHSIDRIDNDLGYCKENCRWATVAEQNLNKRNNVFVTYNNKTQTLKEWCDELQLRYKLIQRRYRSLGWTFEQAITIPDGVKLKDYQNNFNLINN